MSEKWRGGKLFRRRVLSTVPDNRSVRLKPPWFRKNGWHVMCMNPEPKVSTENQGLHCPDRQVCVGVVCTVTDYTAFPFKGKTRGHSVQKEKHSFQMRDYNSILYNNLNQDEALSMAKDLLENLDQSTIESEDVNYKRR